MAIAGARVPFGRVRVPLSGRFAGAFHRKLNRSRQRSARIL